MAPPTIPPTSSCHPTRCVRWARSDWRAPSITSLLWTCSLPAAISMPTTCAARCASRRPRTDRARAPPRPAVWRVDSPDDDGCWPGYLAYIPGGGLFPAALADLITNTTNRYTGAAPVAPALVQLEANVLDWFRDWMGVSTSDARSADAGGSMANFNAIVCARERHLGAEIRAGVLDSSSQAHHSVEVGEARRRSCRTACARSQSIGASACASMRSGHRRRDRRRASSPSRRLECGHDEHRSCRSAGAIADVCAREGLWHHVDGAYGAFFHLCETLRPMLQGCRARIH